MDTHPGNYVDKQTRDLWLSCCCWRSNQPGDSVGGPRGDETAAGGRAREGKREGEAGKEFFVVDGEGACKHDDARVMQERAGS